MFRENTHRGNVSKTLPEKIDMSHLTDQIEKAVKSFEFVFGIASPDSLKGRKLAELRSWLRTTLTKIAEEAWNQGHHAGMDKVLSALCGPIKEVSKTLNEASQLIKK